MKIAKKVLAVVIAVALVAVFGVTAFATDAVVSVGIDAEEEGTTEPQEVVAEPVTETTTVAAVTTQLANVDDASNKTATVSLVSSAANVKVGDEFTITIVVSGDVAELGSGSLPLSFDPTKVEFVTSDKISTKLDMHASAEEAAKLSGDFVNEAFAYIDSLGTNTDQIYYAKFKAKAEGNANFSIDTANAYLTPAEGFDGSYTVVFGELTVGVGNTAVATTACDNCNTTTVVATPTAAATTASIVYKTSDGTPTTGSDAAFALVAGVIVLAGAAFVATNKSKKSK